MIARGVPFAPHPEGYCDAGVAFDTIASLRAPGEPLVLRVLAKGGRAAERAAVEGDWLCDEGGGPPRRIPPPRWDGGSWVGRCGASGRPWLDAWEGCSNPGWMLCGADSIGVDRRLLVQAAETCVRTAQPFLPDATALVSIVRGSRAAKGRAFSKSLSEVVGLCVDALADATPWRVVSVGDALGEGPVDARQRALARLADLVREHVPTLAVLRAAVVRGYESSSRTRRGGGGPV